MITKRSEVWRVILLACLSLIVALWGFYYLFLRMDYVPKEAQIREWLPEFTSEMHNIEGLYGNHDVDSMIFKFEVAPQSSQKVLSEMKQVAERNGWRIQAMKDSTYAQFFRMSDTKAVFSYEECRVAIVPSANAGYLGYVQIDSGVRIKEPKETIEGSWANRVLWPKFREFLGKESASLEYIVP